MKIKRVNGIFSTIMKLNKKIGFAVFIIGAFFINGCGKGKPYSGRLKEDTTWSGKILLTGDLYVEPGVKLTILKDTLIRYSDEKIEYEIQRVRNFSGATVDLFDENKIELIIAGDVNIQGTVKEPVKLKASEDDKKRAGGISFLGKKSTSSVENLIVRGGHVGIRLYDYRSPKMSSVTVTGTEAGGIGCWDRASPKIDMAKINKNKYGLGASDFASPVITGSTIENNQASGVFFEGESSGELRGSSVHGNNVGIACGNKASPHIESNQITANGSGVGCWEDSAPRIEDNILTDNLVGLLSLDNSLPQVSKNSFKNNGGGITVADSSGGKITDNEFVENGPGIIVKNFGFPRISENKFKRNRYGIKVENQGKPVVNNNFFLENEVGFLFTDYSEPEYYGNEYEENRTDRIDSRL
ncbi:MAG: right-handed parallel beta-helix repeat-containing protein [Elusimicrobiota bacterium]